MRRAESDTTFRRLNPQELGRLRDDRKRYEYELSELQKRHGMKREEQSFLLEDYSEGRVEVSEYRAEARRLNSEMADIAEEMLSVRQQIEAIDIRLAGQPLDIDKRLYVSRTHDNR